MDTGKTVYREENAVIEVERVFQGDKTVRELVLELMLQQPREGGDGLESI